MSHSNTFIPGKWLDQIDVNDFVNLNKKPFLSQPNFLKNPSPEVLRFDEQLKRLSQEEKSAILTTKSSIKTHNPSQFSEIVEKIPGKQLFSNTREIGFTEKIADYKNEFSLIGEEEPAFGATLEELFLRSVSANIKKAMKIGFFPPHLGKHFPSMVHPDVRMVALYGITKMIQDKKYHYKQLEERFQTTEWIERRLSLNEEILALEEFKRFCQSYGVEAVQPASNAQEAISILFLTILACVLENPSVSFSLPDVCSFLDIYIEKDIQSGRLSEEEAQELLDLFYLKLTSLRFTSLSASDFGMTLSSKELCKTTYRFLRSVLSFPKPDFHLRFLLTDSIPTYFKEFCEKAAEAMDTVSVHHERSLIHPQNQTIFSDGTKGNVGHDILFSNGECDLLKVFYLALNGGKDVQTNTNLLTNTQPFKQDTLPYDEVYSRFQDALIFLFNLYAQSTNHLMYLSERHLYHPFRYSLLSTFHLYKAQFTFTNVKKVLSLLSSIRREAYSVERNAKGWITHVSSTEDLDSEEELFAPLMSFVHQQLERLPLYKSGKIMIRVLDRELPFSLPPEYIPISFPVRWEEKAVPFSELFREEKLEIYKTRHV